LTYGDGSSVQGEEYTDTVTVSGLTATGQTLGAATTYSTGFSSTYFPPDGLMGLAWEQLSVYGANGFFQTLVAEGKVTSSVFGFKLATSGSELYLGGVDTSLYTGSVTWTPVTQEVRHPMYLVGSIDQGISRLIGKLNWVVSPPTELLSYPPPPLLLIPVRP
jgi:cathepsin D